MLLENGEFLLDIKAIETLRTDYLLSRKSTTVKSPKHR
jgi:hypothetical protein